MQCVCCYSGIGSSSGEIYLMLHYALGSLRDLKSIAVQQVTGTFETSLGLELHESSIAGVLKFLRSLTTK